MRTRSHSMLKFVAVLPRGVAEQLGQDRCDRRRVEQVGVRLPPPGDPICKAVADVGQATFVFMLGGSWRTSRWTRSEKSPFSAVTCFALMASLMTR